jgi:hypothetical protein
MSFMTVMTNPYTKDAIKQTLAEHKNNHSSSSKTSLLPLQDQLDDLRQEMIEFTAKNFSITSPKKLDESFDVLLDRLYDQFQDEITEEQISDVVIEAYEEGARQRAIRDDARNRELLEHTYSQVRSHISLHPEVTFDDFMTSSRIFFRNTLKHFAHLSTAQVEEFFQCALAGIPFVYPDAAAAETETEDDTRDEKKASPSSILDELDAGTIRAAGALEKPTVLIEVPEPQETTSPKERPGTPVVTVVAPEPKNAPIPDMTVAPPVREEVSLSNQTETDYTCHCLGE